MNFSMSILLTDPLAMKVFHAMQLPQQPMDLQGVFARLFLVDLQNFDLKLKQSALQLQADPGSCQDTWSNRHCAIRRQHR
jgi:hypothetical protein